MAGVIPNYWARGMGPTVLCLHCSASSSRQFEPLAEILANRYRVVAVDLYGYGETPAWAGPRPFSLDREVDLLEAVLPRSAERFFIIGHSYGGAVGLAASLRHRERVAGIIVYEPVLFGLLRGSAAALPALREIEAVAARLARRLADGDPVEAARTFVDYWSGPGSFDGFNEKVRGYLASRIAKVELDFEAVFSSPIDYGGFAAVEAPTVLLYGLDSPGPARAVTDLLARSIPGAEVRGLLGQGHMGMATGREAINLVVAKFLDRLRGIGRGAPAPAG